MKFNDILNELKDIPIKDTRWKPETEIEGLNKKASKADVEKQNKQLKLHNDPEEALKGKNELNSKIKTITSNLHYLKEEDLDRIIKYIQRFKNAKS